MGTQSSTLHSDNGGRSWRESLDSASLVLPGKNTYPLFTAGNPPTDDPDMNESIYSMSHSPVAHLSRIPCRDATESRRISMSRKSNASRMFDLSQGDPEEDLVKPKSSAGIHYKASPAKPQKRRKQNQSPETVEGNKNRLEEMETEPNAHNKVDEVAKHNGIKQSSQARRHTLEGESKRKHSVLERKSDSAKKISSSVKGRKSTTRKQQPADGGTLGKLAAQVETQTTTKVAVAATTTTTTTTTINRKRGRPRKHKPMESPASTSEIVRVESKTPKAKQSPKPPVLEPVRAKSTDITTSRMGRKLKIKKAQRHADPFQAIDDRSDLAYRCASAKLRAGDFCGAIRFYANALRQLYYEAEEAYKRIGRHGGDTPGDRKRLLLIRRTLAGIWCSLVRICLEISDQAADVRKKMDRKRHVHNLEESNPLFTRFSELGLAKLDILRAILFDMSLTLLWKASTCCLVGNHAWLGIAYSRIIKGCPEKSIKVLDEREFPPSSTEMKGASIDAAIHFCESCFAQSPDYVGDWNANFSALCPRRISFLHNCGVLDPEAGSIFDTRVFSSSDDTRHVVNDDESRSLLENEIESLRSMRRSADEKDGTTGVVRPIFMISSAISSLPVLTTTLEGDIHVSTTPKEEEEQVDSVPGGQVKHKDLGTLDRLEDLDSNPTPPLIPIQDTINGELSETSTIRKITTPEQAEVRRALLPLSSGHGERCYDIDYDMSPFGNRQQLVKSRARSDLSNTICKMVLARASRNLSGNLATDVEHLCKTCKRQSFATVRGLKKHQRRCPDSMGIENEQIPFGEAKLRGDTKNFSFDPEQGRGKPLQELVQVLDYSVEFFGATREMIRKRGGSGQSVSIHVPSFPGQIGLRCQYCTFFGLYHESESYIFPPSTKDLSTSMWSLCLKHLDHCQRQPRQIRQMHKEFRERVSLDGELCLDYWESVAKDLDIRNKKGGAGIFWRAKA